MDRWSCLTTASRGARQKNAAPLKRPVPYIRHLVPDARQRAHIVKALEQCGWRVSGERGAAKLLELPATTLESRIKRMGLTRPS